MEKKHRMTRQKKVILDILRSTKSHPTADWIYEQAKRKIPNISLGTVYRNLNLLRDMGEILELNYGSTYSRFDGNPENHCHFRCQQCGGVYDLEYQDSELLDYRNVPSQGHEICSHRLEFYGVCRECLQGEN